MKALPDRFAGRMIRSKARTEAKTKGKTGAAPKAAAAANRSPLEKLPPRTISDAQ